MYIGYPTLQAVGAVGPAGETNSGLEFWKAIGETGSNVPTFSPHSLFVADRNFPRTLEPTDSRLGRCPSCGPSSVSTIFGSLLVGVGGASTTRYHITIGE